MPSVPLAKPTVSVPIFFTAGFDTITFDTTFTSLSRPSASFPWRAGEQDGVRRARIEVRRRIDAVGQPGIAGRHVWDRRSDAKVLALNAGLCSHPACSTDGASQCCSRGGKQEFSTVHEIAH